MATTYTWAVTAMQVLQAAGPLQNYVVNVKWTKTGTDDNGVSGVFVGATPFTPNPAQPGFIPFDQLTEADVLSWIQAVVVGDYENHVNGKIQEQINNSANPVVDATLPWAPTP